jgi:hypothetical protein
MSNIQEVTHDPHLRQKIAALLSPEAQHVLDLRFQSTPDAVVIRCLNVPVFMRPAPDAPGMWQFGCPWYATAVPEDGHFEQRILAEVGKVKLLADGDEQGGDPLLN